MSPRHPSARRLYPSVSSTARAVRPAELQVKCPRAAPTAGGVARTFRGGPNMKTTNTSREGS
jgi:hypothetical protein